SQQVSLPENINLECVIEKIFDAIKFSFFAEISNV
ncbi:hypothetical protein YPPY54_0109, partial [Yersinia pestis PY-54]